mgnify:CR=1 FL=1
MLLARRSVEAASAAQEAKKTRDSKNICRPTADSRAEGFHGFFEDLLANFWVVWVKVQDLVTYVYCLNVPFCL